MSSPNIVPGYSSHDIGHLFSMFLPFSRAKMVEKHIKIGNSHFAHFDETTLDDKSEFPDYVKKVQNRYQCFISLI